MRYRCYLLAQRFTAQQRRDLPGKINDFLIVRTNEESDTAIRFCDHSSPSRRLHTREWYRSSGDSHNRSGIYYMQKITSFVLMIRFADAHLLMPLLCLGSVAGTSVVWRMGASYAHDVRCIWCQPCMSTISCHLARTLSHITTHHATVVN